MGLERQILRGLQTQVSQTQVRRSAHTTYGGLQNGLQGMAATHDCRSFFGGRHWPGITQSLKHAGPASLTTDSSNAGQQDHFAPARLLHVRVGSLAAVEGTLQVDRHDLCRPQQELPLHNSCPAIVLLQSLRKGEHGQKTRAGSGPVRGALTGRRGSRQMNTLHRDHAWLVSHGQVTHPLQCQLWLPGLFRPLTSSQTSWVTWSGLHSLPRMPA
jgi:hypothetical protein